MIKKRTFYFKIIAFFYLAVWCTSCANSLGGRLSSIERPIENTTDARVNITRLDSESAKAGQSETWVVEVDEDGEFALDESIENGLYYVEALVPGYKSAMVKVKLEGSKRIELELKPLEVADVQSIDVNGQLEMGRGSGGTSLTPPML